MPDLGKAHEACCKIPTTVCPCPVCGQAGRKVGASTLDSHIPCHLRAGFGDEATFCPNPDCEVVYCNREGQVIRKGETVLPVTAKDFGDDVYLCYCFLFKRGFLRRQLETTGRTDVPDRIKQGVREGRCDCERRNPQGACCLGNVADAVRRMQSGQETK